MRVRKWITGIAVVAVLIGGGAAHAGGALRALAWASLETEELTTAGLQEIHLVESPWKDLWGREKAKTKGSDDPDVEKDGEFHRTAVPEGKKEKKSKSSNPLFDTFARAFDEEIKKAMNRRKAGEKADKQFDRASEIVDEALQGTFKRIEDVLKLRDRMSPKPSPGPNENFLLPWLEMQFHLCGDR